MEAAAAAVEATADDGIEVVKFSGSLCKAGFFRRGGLVDDDEVFAVAADNCTGGKVEPADITPVPDVATVDGGRGGSGDAATVNDVDEAKSC